ncbi:MAG: peptide deformylase [Chloroflexota bacterium]|nr:peptide deformylase [Chloroflexota bacterium]
MPALKIIIEPDPRHGTISQRLRKKSLPVETIDDGVRSLARDMFATLMDASGVGLAAPQVGIYKRLIVVYLPAGYDNEDDPEISLALVNPEIQRAGGRNVEAEGCLSFPDLYGDVQRYANVTVRTQDIDGNTLKIKARGLLARVLQHEIDHLDGILYFDRMEDYSSLRYPTRTPSGDDDEPANEPVTASSRAV